MHANLRALFLDPERTHSESLIQALKPEIFFIDTNFCQSLTDALGIFSTEKIDVCFVSANFPENGAQIFIKDARSIPETATCIFILVQNSVADNFDRDSFKSVGFSTVISRNGTELDKKSLTMAFSAIELRQREEEIQEKIVEVKTSITSLIRELNNVAMDRKRGLNTPFNKVVPNFVSELTKFDQSVLERYYETLSDELKELIAPEGFQKLKIPDELLERELPNIEDGNYTGTSRRLWKRLAKRWGAGEKS